MADQQIIPLTDDEIIAVADDPAAVMKFTSAERRRLSKLKPQRTMLDTAKDVGVGFVKGVDRTALGVASAVRAIPGVAPVTDAIGNAIGGAAGQALYGTQTPPVSGDTAMREFKDVAQSSNTPQAVGGALENVAEAAIPVGKAASAVPRLSRAKQNFETVMAAAKDIPINVEKPGEVAMRIAELAQHGGGTNWGPAPVRQFIQYITDPKKPEMTYQVARDFASNISRLSSKDLASIPPAMMREIHDLRVTLNLAVGDAAKHAGRLGEYRDAMREFRAAMQMRDAAKYVGKKVVKALPYAALAGGAAYYGNEAKKWLGGE
jgi:hypothetical protein